MAKFNFNEFCQAAEYKKKRMAIFVASISLVAAVFLPGSISDIKEVVGKRSSTGNLANEIQSLETQKKDLAARIESGSRQRDSDLNRIVAGGAHTEAQVEHWRKQMAAFSKMRDVKLEITGRSVSAFKEATKVTISLAAANNERLAAALDFIQVFGYIESFDGKTVVAHFR